MSLLRERLTPTLYDVTDRVFGHEKLHQPPSFDVLIVGGGVAGLIQATILLQDAAKRGLSPKIGIVEKGIPGANAFLKANISSNSQGKEFIDFIDKYGPLSSALELPSARALARADEQVVNLSIARQFYMDLGEELRKQGNVEFIQAEVGEVLYHEATDRHIAIASSTDETSDINLLAQARHIVYATGAHELPQTKDGSPLAHYKDKIIVSSDVENDLRIEEIKQRLLRIDKDQRKGAIAIFGNSYSAWASALKLLEKLGDLIPDEGIVLVHRGHGTKLFYDNVKDAVDAGYFSNPPTAKQLRTVDTDKHRVHRFDGIRDGQKDLVIDVLSGNERRVKVVEYKGAQFPLQVQRIFSDATVLVQALGLSANVVAEYTMSDYSRVVPPQGYTGPKIKTTRNGNLDAPNSYGIGLGFDTVDASEIGGRRGFALHAANIYSGFVAPRIAIEILNDLEQQISAERRSVYN